VSKVIPWPKIAEENSEPRIERSFGKGDFDQKQLLAVLMSLLRDDPSSTCLSEPTEQFMVSQ
jgi:hypothetical protein